MVRRIYYWYIHGSKMFSYFGRTDSGVMQSETDVRGRSVLRHEDELSDHIPDRQANAPSRVDQRSKEGWIKGLQRKVLSRDDRERHR